MSVYWVLQWFTMVACSTVSSSAVQVKFMNNWCTCSWVLSSPAMKRPVPKGYEIDDTIRATMPGYKKRLKVEKKEFAFNFSIYSDWNRIDQPLLVANILFLQKHVHSLVGTHKHYVLSMNPHVERSQTSANETEKWRICFNFELNDDMNSSN